MLVPEWEGEGDDGVGGDGVLGVELQRPGRPVPDHVARRRYRGAGHGDGSGREDHQSPIQFRLNRRRPVLDVDLGGVGGGGGFGGLWWFEGSGVRVVVVGGGRCAAVNLHFNLFLQSRLRF